MKGSPSRPCSRTRTIRRRTAGSAPWRTWPGRAAFRYSPRRTSTGRNGWRRSPPASRRSSSASTIAGSSSAPIRAIPRRGCVNLHGSLLPKYRGRSPVNWQLVNGETESGVTLHYIVGRADAGDIIGQERVEVGPEDTAIVLYRKLLPAAERVLRRRLRGILDGTAPRTPQDESQATTFGGRKPEDGRLEWNRSAWELHNLVRAVAPPWPGAFSFAADGRVMILRTRPRRRSRRRRPEAGRSADRGRRRLRRRRPRTASTTRIRRPEQPRAAVRRSARRIAAGGTDAETGRVG